MKDIVMQEIGNAFEILYNLDINLSKHFVGVPDHPNDQGVAGVRQAIQQALAALHFDNWLSAANKIDTSKE